jgi:hypothetical protein
MHNGMLNLDRTWFFWGTLYIISSVYVSIYGLELQIKLPFVNVDYGDSDMKLELEMHACSNPSSIFSKHWFNMKY